LAGQGSGRGFECIDGFAPDIRSARVNRMDDFLGASGSAPKPTGLISAEEVLYLAFQNATGRGENTGDNADVIVNYGHGYDAQIIASSDFGSTWKPSLKEIEKPMCPGRVFRAPAFVNFGKDNTGARDNVIYAISG